MKKHTSVKSLQEAFFEKDQRKRLSAVPKLKNLSGSNAKPLLIEGLNHWDRKLRSDCALAYVKRFGRIATKDIISATSKGLLSKRFSAKLLGYCDSIESFQFLENITLTGPAGASDEAQKSIRKLNIRNAVFWIWVNEGKLTPSLEKKLSTFKISSIKKFLLQGKRDNEILDLFSDPKLRRYLIRHGLIDIYELLGIQIEKQPTGQPSLHPAKKEKQRYITIIAAKAQVSPKLLGWAAGHWNQIDGMYETFSRPKKSGGVRILSSPPNKLKGIQRGILNGVLKAENNHDASHGFKKGRSIVTNATSHTGKKVVINLDLKDFFPSVTSRRVFGIFRSIGSTVQEARFLTRLTTYNGSLPQGAPTSPALANLSCKRLDSRLTGLAKKVEAVYTRYADDISLSGDDNVVSTLPVIRQIIKEEGFQIARHKTRIVRQGNRQEVTGLSVNQKVSVPRPIGKKIRAMVHHFVIGKPIMWNNKVVDINSLIGHLSYLKSVQPEKASHLLKQVQLHRSC